MRKLFSMSWENKVKDFCEEYQIPVEYLAEVLYEPKVVPMIRGKAFEFSTMLLLKDLLPSDKWEVDKTPMNAQQGSHDIDVAVIHKPSKKKIRIECKLAAKGRFKQKNGNTYIGVKCMRSRTLGEGMVKLLAPKIGVSEKVLAIHNDQYVPADFDVVITTIGNAFYNTSIESGKFEWSPTEDAITFLKSLSENDLDDIKKFTFENLYLTKSKDIAINEQNEIVCTRKKCENKTGCGFIPNYPVITFSEGNRAPEKPWIPLYQADEFFSSMIDELPTEAPSDSVPIELLQEVLEDSSSE